MSKNRYNELITGERFEEPLTKRTLNEEFTSDKNRIIFSSPFRRMQQKTQVFSLETNAAVRSRLTHTLEVATIGITISEQITNHLIGKNLLDEQLRQPFIKIVENACLLHDIGNPPFGHFAEEAIKKWFHCNWYSCYKEATNFKDEEIRSQFINQSLIHDFLQFDGNPQGLRIVLKLQDIPDDFKDLGMNMTFSQIASIVKYNANPTTTQKHNFLFKKAGHFFSEEKKITYIKRRLGITGRYPLTYIMEAADDISYCLSDIEDGIEKSLLNPKEFFARLLEQYNFYCKGTTGQFQKFIEGRSTKKDFFHFKIDLIRELEKYAVESYLSNHGAILDGSFGELIDKSSDHGKILLCLKYLSRKHLFRSKETENKELAGYHAIYGMLDKYLSLLNLKEDKFNNLIASKQDINTVLGSGMDLEWRLFNRLPQKYIDSYQYEYNKDKSENDRDQYLQLEWFNRAHLMLDYISGMTDNYILETYSLLYGIKI